VDIVTHGLASWALTRALFPRAGKLTTAAAIAAGCVAEADWLANYFGAPAALAWRGTYLHSILAALIFCFAIPGVCIAWLRSRDNGALVSHQPEGASPGGDSFTGIMCACLATALLHLAMDACQSFGVMLFWPFSMKRFAADWLPPIDPWILTILLLAIGVPDLLHLVSSEIGARSKKPRGRTAAFIGLALAAAYIGARGTLHSNAVALMEARTFHGEPARRARAFPEALSPIDWHGVAETEGALNVIDVNLAAAAAFDADTSTQLFKPEQSAILDAARNSRVARQFLAIAQMPKASVEKTDVGSVVILRDMRYAVSGETRHEIAALIEFDPDNKMISQEIVWARELRGSLYAFLERAARHGSCCGG
jgi:LexA-binding, inner membrane-associated putative hydrolase